MEGKILVSQSAIMDHYLKGWFTVDLLSTVPFDELVPLIIAGVSSGALRSVKAIRAVRLLRLFKVFRVARLSRKLKDAKSVEILDPTVLDLGSLFFKIIFVAHLLSCFYYYFSGCNHDDYGWIVCGHHDMTSRYLVSFYWTLATMLGVGYGDVTLFSNAGLLAAFIFKRFMMI